MGIKIEYKGWEFEFDHVPSDQELKQRYRARVEDNEVTLAVPRPQPLERDNEPWRPDLLADHRVAVCTSIESELAAPVVEALARLEADVQLTDDVGEIRQQIESDSDERAELSALPGEPSAMDGELNALIFDASRLGDEPFDDLYAFFHRWTEKLDDGGRVIVLSRPTAEASDSREAAFSRGTDGFSRSLAKEFGGEGTTANRVVVERGAEQWAGSPVAFLTSRKSVYVSSQPWRIRQPAVSASDSRRDESVLEGKTAVVTGASRGIGRATAAHFAREGADVICISRPGSETLGEVEDEFGGIPVGVDVADEEAPERVAEIARDHGGIDVLVHNAGTSPGNVLTRLSRETWETTMEVNIQGPIRITEHLLEEGLISEGGRILCTTSVNATSGAVALGHYAASKAGLIGFVEHAAETLAEQGMTVNAVAPGFVETKMTDQVPEMMREAARRLNALSQPGHPEDVANVMTFLARSSAQGINGQLIRVCGGAFQGS